MNYHKLLFSLMPAIIWMVIIFTLSSFEAAPITQFHLLEFLIKKTIHMIEYGILWWLIFRALSQATKFTSAQLAAYSLLFTTLYAISDEYHQTFVPSRHGTVRDVIIDTLGALIAYYLYFRLPLPVIDKHSKHHS